MRLPWHAHHAPAIAFAVLALVGGFSLKEASDHQTGKLYDTQIAGCERNNTIRKESNDRIQAHEADAGVLNDFLIAARNARIASYQAHPTEGDKAAIEEYTRLISVLDAKVKFNRVPLINCKEAIPKP